MTQTLHRYRILLAGVLLITALVYASGLSGPLFFDDLPNLIQNPLLQINGQVFDHWRTAALSADAGPLGRPVSLLSFALSHVLAGEFSGLSLKVMNLLIHLCIGCVVYLLTDRLLRAPVLGTIEPDRRQLASLVAAAIWLLHPLHVSTVLYAIQRMAQLSSLFVLLGLYIFSRYRLRWANQGAPVGEIMAAALWLLLITVLAAFSKENGALLPWLVLLVEVALFRGVWEGSTNKPLKYVALFFFALPIVLLIMVLLIAPEIFTDGFQARDFSLKERVFTQSRVLWQYLGWWFWPDIRAMGFYHDDIAISRSLSEPISTSYSLMAWFVMSVVAVIMRHRLPLLLFSFLFFIIAHSMESSVIALEMVFEHRNYLPSVGVCMLLAYLLVIAAPASKRMLCFSALSGLLCVLVILLLVRVELWSNESKLAKFDALNHPSSARANYSYGSLLFLSVLQGRDEFTESQTKAYVIASREKFVRTLEIDPQHTAALVSLFYIDTAFFPELGERNDWLSALEKVLRDRVLQASDYAAFSMLVTRISSIDCKAYCSKIERLVFDLHTKNPDDIRAFLIKYDLLVAADASLQERIDLLEAARDIAPLHPSVQYLLIRDYGLTRDIAAMYVVARDWMALDSRRTALPIIKGLFVEAGDHVE